MSLTNILSEHFRFLRNLKPPQVNTNLVYVGSNKPIILFHGSDSKFDEFKYSDDGGFHFGSYGHAVNFVDYRADEDEFDTFEGLYSVVLEVKNVVGIDDLQYWQDLNFQEFIERNIDGVKYDFSLDSPIENLNRPEIKKYFETEMKTDWTNPQYDIDCLVYYNDYETSGVPTGFISDYIKFMKKMGVDDEKNLKFSLNGKYSFCVLNPKLIKIIYK